jgi:tripartite-type tricarboxylate transporter receptor subunit TctC
MKLPRRRFLHMTAGVAALAAASGLARAQTYPTRPVHIIVPAAAGGVADIVARLTGQSLSGRLGQPFVIENRPGAGTIAATEAVVRASADGHTLLLIAAQSVIAPMLYDSVNFNFIRDIAPVGSIIRLPLAMVVNPSVPAKTVPEFITYAKANPGKLSMGSSGNGSLHQLAGELFKMTTGVDLVHVPYRGEAPALVDVMGGQVPVMFVTVPGCIEQIRAGKVRPLAVTTTVPLEALPNVPTMSDFLAGYEVSGWNGIGAPKNTPTELIDNLNKEINAAAAEPRTKARIADLGGEPMTGSSAAFGRLIAEETEKWLKVVKFANIKAE